MSTFPLESLSLSTFSSVWYWITAALVWTTVGQRPMGVPIDLVWPADDKARAELDIVARAMAERTLERADRSALGVGLFAALLTALALLAGLYGLEFAQGALFLVAPMVLVAWRTHRVARAVAGGADPEPGLKRLAFAIHMIGLASLLLAAIWGGYLHLSSLGL